jgi:pimeloyl-ACP methyl ester carboxylesterase
MLEKPPSADKVNDFLSSATGRMLAVEAPDNLASLTGFFRREPRDVTSALLTRISRDGPGVTDSQLSSLSIPTLVIGHGEDVVHPMAHARYLANLIPAARLVEIPPKTRGREAYESGFRGALGRFIQELQHASSPARLV